MSAPTAASDTTHSPPGRVTPGSKGFIAIISMAMATTALAIDSVLPAYGAIREAFDLAPDSTEVTGLITAFFLGSSIGMLPAGLISDRFGRKTIIWVGMALYIVGAVAAVFAPSLTEMLIARFVWGLGSAGPRVAAMAMIRDSFVGDAMARQISFVMAVFLLIPAVAPSLSVGVMAIGSWQWVYWMCVVVAAAVSGSVFLLPETLADVHRRPLSAPAIFGSYRTVITAPGMGWYIVALSMLFGSFMAFLAGSELIIDQTYHLEAWFPVFFGGAAIVMLGSMLLNGNLVDRLGLDRLLGYLYTASIVVTSAMAVIALATSGKPPFWLFCVNLGLVLFVIQMVIPNLNAGAMRPLGAVAGTGAAVLTMVSGVAGSLLGEAVNARFDGTVRPLAIGFVISCVVSFAAWTQARRTQVPLAQQQ